MTLVVEDRSRASKRRAGQNPTKRAESLKKARVNLTPEQELELNTKVLNAVGLSREIIEKELFGLTLDDALVKQRQMIRGPP